MLGQSANFMRSRARGHSIMYKDYFAEISIYGKDAF